MRAIIIGAGASGMAAALTAARRGHTVTLLERQARAGRKLMATGNGRCNLTNTNASPEHYHGTDVSFMRRAMEALPPQEALEFFRGIGLLTVEESGGRVYPLSNSANSVVDVLRFALESAHVQLAAGDRGRYTGTGTASPWPPRAARGTGRTPWSSPAAASPGKSSAAGATGMSF